MHTLFTHRGRQLIVENIPRTEEIEAFSAVALAGLGWLPIRSYRGSVIIRMRRRPGERVEPFRHRIHAPQGARIREMIETWARSVTFEITEKLPNEIQDRDADVWESLITIADAVGGDWPKRARVAAVALITEAKERDPSLGVRLLADLKSIFGVAQEMTTEAIAGASCSKQVAME